ncbi:acetyltransferase [Fulvivirga sp. 29W222]|uniref:Acetyltransferase n=1 Tax=Fulvivirga marina TaxID=2494733 RepID=A0A937KF33_9BACT|nr:GNAT family N-acetyltransferase [Fulvivirga marina]MBL6447830.1 acetyltransferase [Fulvivirga marina]QHG11729.1 putative acyl CoA acyltransferase [Fulvivirga marina]
MKTVQERPDVASDREIIFSREMGSIGLVTLSPLNLEEDSPLIHDWVNRDYAKYWMMQDTSLEDVRKEYQRLLGYSDIFIGTVNGKPSFLMEKYKAADEIIGKYYNIAPGDYGMHILVAPAEQPIQNFTWYVFRFIMTFLFSDDRVERVVVEPDIRNKKIHGLNRRAGFEYESTIKLPHKTACLAFCNREQFRQAIKNQP